MAGGFGTRLRPLSCTRPKILFPILNKPLLQWLFEKIAEGGVGEVILAVNRQTEFQIKQHKLPKNSLKLIFSRDPPGKPLGTGGPIKRAERHLHEDDFLTLNGDIFADIDYTKLLNFHRETGAIATIALYRAEDPSRYGVVELNGDYRIRSFIEKPRVDVASSNLINAGVYAMNRKILEYIPRGRKVSLEKEVFPKLAMQGKLYGYIHNGLWSDIGKIEDYLNINMSLLDVQGCGQKNVECLESVEIKNPVLLGEKSSISLNSVIGPYVILGSNVKIGKNVKIRNSIILSGAAIQENTVIDGAVIGENVRIGRNVEIGRKCVIGDYVVISDGVSLGEGVTVCPGKEVSGDVSPSGCII